ncbi:MAG: V-type ATP synthase subunit E [Thaumarchaeota archaeon]|nr:V-type ATP synthase subunit E [Nitrososphaerota archaeon]|tara:strand:+ start:9788 stop:10393 length:606 start_codon:yes stop_codon:yes gene_type:complete
MDTNSALEQIINKVLSQAESDMISKIDVAYDDAEKKLMASKHIIESDYNKIMDDARKQAENLKKQIVGNSRLSTRNKQLVLIEEAVSDAFEKAKTKIDSVRSSNEYVSMMKKLLEDGLNSINAEEVIVECNGKDRDVVKKMASELGLNLKMKINISEEAIDVLGGLRVMSKDGSMVYDNTLDSRIERLKPIIRKDIAIMFK